MSEADKWECVDWDDTVYPEHVADVDQTECRRCGAEVGDLA